MYQTTLSLVLELDPQSDNRVRDLLKEWQEGEAGAGFGPLASALPGLHFLSAAVFSDSRYDPVLAIEANFDGDEGPFWAQLEAGYGDLLRQVLACCKPPVDGRRTLFADIVRPGSRRAVAPFLEASSTRPMVFHHGNRGLDRARIAEDAALFLATRRELADPALAPDYAAATPGQVHARLRERLMPQFPSLARPVAPRITPRENFADWFGLVGFGFLALFCLSVPGMLLAAFAHPGLLLFWTVVVGAAAWWGVRRLSDALPGQAAPRASGALRPSTKHPITSWAHPVPLAAAGVVLLVAYVWGVSWVVAIPVRLLVRNSFGAAWGGTRQALELGLLTCFATVPLILVWLRLLERRDSSHDRPVVLDENRTAMAEIEDKPGFAMNHMGSMVLVKPGVLRMVLIRAGLWGLGRVVRVAARDGYLGSMRTIHFAHWAMANNGSRLLFFSNFDGSWESYLDDFIEKAHGGLSLAWGNSVGFPPARFLVIDGASHGRRFKAWARQSMAPTSFWFSAYPKLTVNQIERQAALSDGLRQPSLTPHAAALWIRTL